MPPAANRIPFRRESCGKLPDAPAGEPGGVRLDSPLRAAGRDWAANALPLAVATLATGAAWGVALLAVTALAGLLCFLSAVISTEAFGLGRVAVAVCAFAGMAAWTAAAGAVTGVAALAPAALCLAAARGEPAGHPGRPWRDGFAPRLPARGRRRAALAGASAALFLVGFGVTSVWLLFLAAEAVWGTGPMWSWQPVIHAAGWAAGAAAAGGLWVLFWPLPFVILDRPDLKYLRPAAACLGRLPGRWGGQVAAGTAAGALLLIGALPWGLGLPFAVPLAGLILAHAHDREERSGRDGDDPPPPGSAGAI